MYYVDLSGHLVPAHQQSISCFPPQNSLKVNTGVKRSYFYIPCAIR